MWSILLTSGKFTQMNGGALLLLLRMQRCFLRLQISDQPGKPFDRDLIANGQEYSPVMLDLFIEVVALVAHGEPFLTRRVAKVRADYFSRLQICAFRTASS
jgi:hypothetical protein